MTRNEAREALKQGKKITHRYFSDDEFVMLANDGTNRIQDENGFKIESAMFWHDRAGAGFDEGWEVYKRIKCNCPCHRDKNVKHVRPCCTNGYIIF